MKNEILLNEFFLLFPKNKLGVLEKKITISGRRLMKGQRLFAMYLRDYPEA